MPQGLWALASTHGRISNDADRAHARSLDLRDHGRSRASAAGERFDVVILDPPALIKRRKDRESGLSAYHHLNQLGMQLIAEDGLLVSASCSLHLERLELVDTLRRTSLNLKKGLQIVGYGHQGPDHPIHPAINETEYLKVIYSRINAKPI